MAEVNFNVQKNKVHIFSVPVTMMGHRQKKRALVTFATTPLIGLN